jgi:hypothetical protein
MAARIESEKPDVQSAIEAYRRPSKGNFDTFPVHNTYLSCLVTCSESAESSAIVSGSYRRSTVGTKGSSAVPLSSISKAHFPLEYLKYTNTPQGIEKIRKTVVRIA